jgi:hypothetical protein
LPMCSKSDSRNRAGLIERMAVISFYTIFPQEE